MRYNNTLQQMDLKALSVRQFFKTWLNTSTYSLITAVGTDDILAKFRDSEYYVIIHKCLEKTFEEIVERLEEEAGLHKLLGI